MATSYFLANGNRHLLFFPLQGLLCLTKTTKCFNLHYQCLRVAGSFVQFSPTSLLEVSAACVSLILSMRLCVTSCATLKKPSRWRNTNKPNSPHRMAPGWLRPSQGIPRTSPSPTMCWSGLVVPDAQTGFHTWPTETRCWLGIQPSSRTYDGW